MMHGSDSSKDYYRILGVAKTANASNVKRAYYQLAKKYHPDKTGGDVKKAEQFKVILEAYEVLSDPYLKRSYDDSRSVFGYQTPGDDSDNTSDFQQEPKKTKTKTKARSKKAKAATRTARKANDGDTEEFEIPPEFRERARSTYSYTYPSPGSSQDHTSSPKSSADDEPKAGAKAEPKAGAKAEPQSGSSEPANADNALRCTFSDYFHDDLTEKPFLLNLRLAKRQTLRAWRYAKNRTAEAKFAFEFLEQGGNLATLQAEWEMRKRDQWKLWADKRSAEHKLDDHEPRAKVLLERAKHERAKSAEKKRKRDQDTEHEASKKGWGEAQESDEEHNRQRKEWEWNQNYAWEYNPHGSFPETWGSGYSQGW